jgi:hypothetical protein
MQNSIEKQLHSWMPRRPSAKITRRLFSRVAPARVCPRATEVWNWLAPATACGLALMVTLHGASRPLPRLNAQDNATFFATLMLNAARSNVQQTFLLSQMDENMEWNIWPHPLPAQTVRHTGSHSSLNVWSVIPTNH